MSKKFNPSNMFSLSSVKKATAQIQSSMTGHTELSMAMYSEKCIVEAVERVTSAKSEAIDCWEKWAEKEDSGPLREMILKLSDLDMLWVVMHNEYAETANIHRKIYKQVMKGEQSVDDLQKQVDEANKKIQKAQKQHDSAVKSRDKKGPHYATELQKAILEADTLKKQLATRKMNHAVFKYGKVREAYKPVMDSQIELHEKCLEIAKGRRAILELYTGQHYHSMTPDMVLNASVDATNIINELTLKVEGDASAIRRQASAKSTDSGSNSSWAEDATYQGIPGGEQGHGDILNSPSQRQGGVVDISQVQTQRPLPQVPDAPPEDEYDYIEPSQYTRGDPEQPNYLVLQANMYDNSETSNEYMPMSRPTSTPSTAASTPGYGGQYQLPPQPNNPNIGDQYQGLPAPPDGARNMYPQLPNPDDPTYDMAGQGGTRPISTFTQNPQ